LSFIHTKTSGRSEPELLEDYIRHQDPRILAELYQPYMELVYGVCLKYLSPSEDARDAVRHIYEELVEKLKSHRVEHFKGWLYRVAVNHCLMILRRKKPYVQEWDPDRMESAQESHPEEAWDRESRLALMEKCLQTLNADQKTCVELFYLKSICYKEIARQTGWEAGRVKSHIQNGRRNLKLCMESNATPLTA
jgi:RNA polymerase sigma factor (sigma-70 family)